jgi:hypothetical protein
MRTDLRPPSFNLPLGVAIGRDGTVFVADAKNRCIRAIERVSSRRMPELLRATETSMGNETSLPFPSRAPSRSAATASYMLPTIRTACASSNRTARSALLTGIDQRYASFVTSASTVHFKGKEILVATSVDTVWAFADGKSYEAEPLKSAADLIGPVMPPRVIAPPTGVAALSYGWYAYADAAYSSVDLCFLSDCQFLSRTPRFDALSTGRRIFDRRRGRRRGERTRGHRLCSGRYPYPRGYRQQTDPAHQQPRSRVGLPRRGSIR